MSNNSFIIYGVGDNMPFDKDPDDLYKDVKGLFTAEDALVFGQLEGVACDCGSPAAQARLPVSCDITLPNTMKRNGFDIVSFASNHTMDWGREGFSQCVDLVKRSGLELIGVGHNEKEARKAVYIEKNGCTIAFLGYCSVLPQDYWAQEARPGCNPARALTATVPVEHDQPGTPLRQYTFPHPDDLRNMQDDIAEAKKNADLVIVSIHWGIHLVRALLADYQRYYAHFAIDAGADAIFGHHAHCVKGIEVYKGKPVFYSLGNFCCSDAINPRDLATIGQELTSSKKHKEMARLGSSEKMPGRRHGIDHYMHTIAKCVVEDKKIKAVSFIPSFIDEKGVIAVQKPGDEYFDTVVDFTQAVSEEAGLKTCFKRNGNEINIDLTL